MSIQNEIDKRNRFLDAAVRYLQDRDGRISGPVDGLRAAMATLYHDFVLPSDNFDDIETFPPSEFGSTNFTQLADLQDAPSLASYFVGQVLDLGHGAGHVVYWGRDVRFNDPAIPISGIEAADIPRHPAIPPLGLHAGYDQWLMAGDFLDPAVDFDAYGTLFYSLAGTFLQDDLAAKIALWTGRLIIYARGSTAQQVNAFVQACGGTTLLALPQQRIRIVDVP